MNHARAKRSVNPNGTSPNAALSVRDVQLIIRELEGYEKRIAAIRGTKIEQRFARKLLDKLYQVKWRS